MSTVAEISESVEKVEQKLEATLCTIAMMIEDHMTEEGLTEAEKNAKTADFSEYVTEALRAKLVPDAKRSQPLEIAASHA